MLNIEENKFMRPFRVILYLILPLVILSCKEKNRDAMKVKMIIHNVDSLIVRGSVINGGTGAFKSDLVKASSMLKNAALLEPKNNVVRQLQVITYVHLRAPDSVILVYSNWIRDEPSSLEPNLKRGLMNHILKREYKAKSDFAVVKKILSKRLIVVNKNTTNAELNHLITTSFNFFLIGEKNIAYKILSDIITV